MSARLFYGEAAGGRILRGGSGATQVTAGGTEPVLADATTMAVALAGAAGDLSVRGVDVTLAFTNGYDIAVIPIVDDVALPEQRFTRVGGRGQATVQAWIAVRGSRVAVRARQVTRSGDVEFINAAVVHVPLRATP